MILPIDFVVIDSKDHVIRCKRCGKRENLPLPLELTKFVRWSTDWAEGHAKCRGTAISRNGLPQGIGWWWDEASKWNVNRWIGWLAAQSRERLVQMLQETDPNGCWADEQAMAEIGAITSIETAKDQMMLFWKDSVCGEGRK